MLAAQIVLKEVDPIGWTVNIRNSWSFAV